MTKKQNTAWAIRHWDCGFYTDTVRAARRDSIESFCAAYGVSQKKWRYYVMHRINRAVKVTLVETR